MPILQQKCNNPEVSDTRVVHKHIDSTELYKAIKTEDGMMTHLV